MKSKKLLILLSLVFLMTALLTVTACTVNKYTVTFEVNGNVEKEIELQTVREKQKVTKPEDPVSTENFVFEGWFKDAALEDPFNFDTDKITEDTTLYAKWSVGGGGEFKITITYDFQGGEGSETGIEITSGQNFEFVVPTREGYSFIGWYSHENAKGFKYTSYDGKSLSAWSTAATNLTVYAYWYKQGGEPYEYGLGKLKAPDFTVDLLNENGKVKSVKLSDYYGVKPVLINVWSTT